MTGAALPRVEEIASWESFDALRGPWDALLSASGQESPFLSHDWFACCARAVAEGREPRVLLAWDGDALVGIAPLWGSEQGAAPDQDPTISFITSSETAFVDFITLDERRRAVLQAFVRHWYESRPRRWRRVDLGQWPEESRHYGEMLEILRQERKPFFTRTASITPYLSVQGDWDSYFQHRPLVFRKAYRRIRNRIADLPRAEVELIRTDPEGTLVDTLLEISRRSWKDREGVALSNRPDIQRFFRELTARAGPNGWLMAWLLKVDGRPIAMEYDLAHDGKVYALRADFDEAHRSVSPGSYLEYWIIKDTFDRGWREYCSGPGLKRYKLRWTDTVRTNRTVTLCPTDTRGVVDWLWNGRVRPFLVEVRDRVRPSETEGAAASRTEGSAA